MPSSAAPIVIADSITRVAEADARGAVGGRAGRSCRNAAAALQSAEPARAAPPPALEAAFLLIPESPPVWALDSASLAAPEHHDAIVLTGSHGGLLGGRPETALKYDVRAAFYNDAGIGIDEAGVSRLPALDDRSIAAATVSAATARIGEARSPRCCASRAQGRCSAWAAFSSCRSTTRSPASACGIS